MFEDLQAKAIQILCTEYGISDCSVVWERPAQPEFGDLATPVSMQLARTLKKNPKVIAGVLAEKLAQDASVEKAEVAGPGYVNIWLKPAALLQELQKTREACTARVTRKEPPVIVEYSQPNIAKPLAIHHVIGTVLGQAIVNLYRHGGANVISWNYIGDWGTQFGKLAVAYELWGKDKPVKDYTLDELLVLYVKFHNAVADDESLEVKGREAFLKLEQGDKSLRMFWQDVVDVTKSSLASIYQRLHVSFDLDLGESFYEDKMESVLEEGKKKKVFTEGKEGALIVDFPEGKNLPPYLVLKGDGATLYSTRDIAQMRYRINEYSPQKILICTDIAQKLHFEQLVETCHMLDWTLPEFENVLFGRMRFADKSMSTRKGNVLKLEEVVDEAVERAAVVIKDRGDSIQTDDPEGLAEMMGVGSLVYGILSQNRQSDLVFDWDRMLSFEGDAAPYLQYTHARARSVLRKAELDDATEFPSQIQNLSASERALVSGLLRFPEALEEAQRSHLPHILTHYLYQLCQNFNAFYNSEPILQSPEPQKSLRIALTALTATVLKSGAELLTLRVPDRM